MSTPNVAVVTPTFDRPDFIRMPLLQMMAQKRQLDVLTIHQNGSSYDYRWAIADFKPAFHVQWIFTQGVIPQDMVVCRCPYANHTDKMLHTLVAMQKDLVVSERAD